MRESWEVDLDRHLSVIDREESRDQAIESHMAQSMGVGEAYHPFNALNFIEGLKEGNYSLLKTACELMDGGNDLEAIKLLKQVSHDYWAAIAREDAELEVDNPDEDDFDEPDREWP